MNKIEYWSLGCDILGGPKDRAVKIATAQMPEIAKDIATAMNQPDATEKPMLPSMGNLLADWYESAPYGEQTPPDLPGKLVKLLAEYGVTIDEEDAWQHITGAVQTSPWANLFGCIFDEGAKYTLRVLEDRDLIRHNSELSQPNVE
jgi:hypothetical protein